MKYIIYIRVSKEEQIHSLEVQRQACRDYIINQDPGATIMEFKDVEYCGALTFDKRPGLFDALMHMGRGDIMVIQKRDRLGRDPVNNAMIEAEINNRKGALVSATSDFSNENDPYSILMRRMLDVFSEHERLVISARTKAALRMKRAKNEIWGTLQFGFKLGDDGIHPVPCEKEFPVLQMMIDMRESGFHLYHIAKKLKELGMPNRKGNVYWTTDRVKEILEKSEYVKRLKAKQIA